MKILCVSDQIDPLIYTNSLKQRYADVSLILSAGDLPMDYLDFILSTLNKPMLFVFGNHHTKYFSYCSNRESTYYPNSNFDQFDKNDMSMIPPIGGSHVSAKVLYEEGLIIAGLGGCMRYNGGENQFTEFQMKLQILKILPALFFNRIFRGRFLDILLTHASPRGIHDKEDICHMGFKCFLWFMRVFRPRYLVHGHIHLYDLSEVRTTKYYDTLVVNAFSHYIIDTGEII
jgi:Icc-related predicted phosphoesterase